MRDRNIQSAILEGLSHVNEDKYMDIDSIRSNSKLKSFFVDMDIVDAFYDFMMTWENQRKKYYKEKLPGLDYKSLSFSIGRNYIKIVTDHSVSAFVDRFGNVYKPASWNAPASGVRYYLDDYDKINFDAYGSFLYGNSNLPPRTEEFYEKHH